MELSKKRYHVNIMPNPPLNLGIINVFQISDLACALDYEVPLHRQNCYEISYIVDGEGVFRCGDIEHRVHEGDLHLATVGDLHYIKSSRHAPLRYICLGFTFNKAHSDYPKYAAMAEFFETPEKRLSKDHYKINNLLTGALREISGPGFLSEEMLSAFLLQTLISTYRSFREETGGHRLELDDHRSLNPLVYEMLRYIDDHVTDMGALSDMAEKLGYNYSYLSRLFSAAMGTTPKQYYDRQRFERAVQMLQEGKRLSRIAEKLGFADAATFCKAFKRFYNVSPGQYRSKLG